MAVVRLSARRCASHMFVAAHTLSSRDGSGPSVCATASCRLGSCGAFVFAFFLVCVCAMCVGWRATVLRTCLRQRRRRWSAASRATVLLTCLEVVVRLCFAGVPLQARFVWDCSRPACYCASCRRLVVAVRSGLCACARVLLQTRYVCVGRRRSARVRATALHTHVG